tara:strand:+ start:345 stop:578 length:234 start_codon:yes stop_codon:yes gene_type:complete
MNPEVALLLETWDSIKSYLPKKERLNIAEILVRTFDDNVDISEVESSIMEFDSIMKAAIVSHFDIGIEEDEEDEDWD